MRKIKTITSSGRVKLAALALAMCMLLITGAPKAGAYTPPVSVVKIGLYYGTSALPSANLQNVDGYGGGFEFGYFDSKRNFIPLDAATDIIAITMMMDRNMYYYSGGSFKEYREGTEGSIVVGCYHAQSEVWYASYAEADAVAAMYQSSFVKFDSGKFYVCVGNYTTLDEASNAIAASGLSSFTVNAGTANTITVVETGTNNILLEFDYGKENHFGVLPVSNNGFKCETWFKGYRYYGGFRYMRQDDGALNVANYVDIEDYVKGVIQHEMSPGWPLEALKAQACCARTYAMANLNKHSSSGFDLCTGEHCQRYLGRNNSNVTTDRAVDETAGMYITYNGTLCQTYYSSSDGGATENSENVWKDTLPYARGVVDPYEAAVTIPNYNWTVTYTPEQLTQRLRDRNYNCAAIVSITVSEYTPTGNVLKVTLVDANGTPWSISKGENLRYALGVKSMRFTIGDGTRPGGAADGIYVNGSSDIITGGSSYYAIGGDGATAPIQGGGQMYAVTGTGDIEQVSGGSVGGSGGGIVNGVITLYGTGNGHSVGMSQYGAYSMAKNYGKTYRDIINFYYTGVTIG